jgi:DNA-binding NarL/FixJ family response regulator
MMGITILLADSHEAFRVELRALINSESEMKVVAEAGDGKTAVNISKQLSPDIVITDIALTDMNGISATRAILEAMPQTRVIALSDYTDRIFVSGMLQAGASGYISKDCAFEEVAKAVGAVSKGQIYLSPKIAEKAFRCG